MKEFKNLDLFTLMDLLVKNTDEYMKMFKEGATEHEFARCKEIILHLTDEIKHRKKQNTIAKQAGMPKDGN